MYPKWPNTDAAGNSMLGDVLVNDLVSRTHPVYVAFPPGIAQREPRLYGEDAMKQKIRDMLRSEYGLEPKEPTK